MEKKELAEREHRPTWLQMQYLICLEQIGNRRGNIAMIAEKCGVSHGPVSRYLKSCYERGLLTEQYEFTQSGKAALEGYHSLLQGISQYLKRIGIPAKDISKNLRNLVEHVDHHVLLQMVRSDSQNRELQRMEQPDLGKGSLLEEVLAYGKWEICFALYRQDVGNGIRRSMADKGFLKPGILKHNKRGCWLELSVCDMEQPSRIDGTLMTGRLHTLKYEQEGILHQARVINGKVKIPLNCCRLQRKNGGKITGYVSVTATCTVGNVHMPERSALLIFWL